MPLPFAPPLEPMLAKLAAALPPGEGWSFEPKWDGFRALVFRDGESVHIQSRGSKPLERYFPDLVQPFRDELPARCVVDGEIVIIGPGGLDFEALQLRLHPAASRVDMLAGEQPAAFVAFDLLAWDDRDLRGMPQAARRAELDRALAHVRPPVHLSPETRDRDVAARWFAEFEGAGLDGVIAKPLDAPYQPGVRAMLKVKHVRTADCVVAGFRWHKNGPGTLVGSLLLGLYDDGGVLHHVGITSSFTMARRKALVTELEPLRDGAAREHPWVDAETSDVEDEEIRRRPGAQSRWSQGKDMTWEPVRIERVCEVKYDHLQGTRFRHATTFVRWRPDKAPTDCRFDQLEVTPPYELTRIFGGGPKRPA
jgi:ATP-dependent DNA ligase